MNKFNNFSVAASNHGHLTSSSQECRPQRSVLFDDCDQKEFLTIKEVARIYKICSRSIYDLIKTDPSFPYINVGLKKKYMIERENFEQWLKNRTRKEQINSFKIVSPEKLMKKGEK